MELLFCTTIVAMGVRHSLPQRIKTNLMKNLLAFIYWNLFPVKSSIGKLNRKAYRLYKY